MGATMVSQKYIYGLLTLMLLITTATAYTGTISFKNINGTHIINTLNASDTYSILQLKNASATNLLVDNIYSYSTDVIIFGHRIEADTNASRLTSGLVPPDRLNWTDLNDTMDNRDDDTTYSAAANGGLVLTGTEFHLTTGCLDGQVLKNESGGWTCAADDDSDTTYTAVANGGLELTGTGFHMATGCSDGNVMKNQSGGWVCAADDGGSSYIAQSEGGLALDGSAFRMRTCTDGQVLKNESGGWSCAEDTAPTHYHIDDYVNWTWTVNIVNTSTEFGGEVSGTYDAIVLDDDALDDQYYDSEADLTGLLDDNYASISSVDSVVTNLTNINGSVAQWDEAHGWGNHADAGYEPGDDPTRLNTTTAFGGEVSGTYDAIVLDDDALDDQYYDSEADLTGLLDDNYASISSVDSVVTNLTNINGSVAQWDEAYGWGDWSTAVDNVVTNLTNINGSVAQWDEAYTWGNHADAGYATSDDPTQLNTTTEFGGEVSGTYDAIVLDDDALDDQYYDSEADLTTLLDDNYASISSVDSVVTNLTNINGSVAHWDEAYGWGNHADAGYEPGADPTRLNTTTEFGGEVSGTYDAIVLDDDALDDQYYDDEADLTGLLDDNYAAITVIDVIVTNLTNINGSVAHWDEAYGWGDHSTQNYLDDDVAGDVDADDLAADIIDETKLADNSIDSEHYNDDSIDDAHINWGSEANQVDSDDVPEGSTNFYDDDGVDDDTPDDDSEVPNDITIESGAGKDLHVTDGYGEFCDGGTGCISSGINDGDIGIEGNICMASDCSKGMFKNSSAIYIIF